MSNNIRPTHRRLPVLIGIDRQQIMAKADIYRSKSETLIQITITGSENQLFVKFLEQVEPIGLSFGPIPVQNIIEKRETN